MTIRSARVRIGALAAACLLAGGTFAQGAPALDRREARVERAAPGRTLTPPSAEAPVDVVVRHLRNAGRGDAVASLRSERSSPGAHGTRHLRLQQVIDGLVVHGAFARAALGERGELLQITERLAPSGPVSPSRIDAHTALKVAMTALHPAQPLGPRRSRTEGATAVFDGNAFFHRNPTVTAVVVPLADGTLERGWLVQTWARRSNALHHTLVGGDGRVLDVESRTASDRYHVFVEDPLKAAQVVVNGPGGGTGTGASPAGWLSGAQTTNAISGNNTRAYLDVDANNLADAGGSAVVNGDFLATASLTTTPASTANRAVAVQNLFYLSNRIHDTLHALGFDEAAGNFQVSNFGRGGLGNDRLLAEAQDGSSVDNATFATPLDGASPRMQIPLWSSAQPTHSVSATSSGGATTNHAAKGATFGPVMSTTGTGGTLARPVPADACTTGTASLSGKVALIDRGTCSFTIKVLNAQRAGAKAVVIANNTGGTVVSTMSGTDSRITIPSVMVSQNSGAALKALAAPTVTARRLAVQPLALDGALDSDIVFHEFAHGLSWRMIGTMSGPLAGAIGEGNSDGIAMLMNGNDVIGEYASGRPGGIRRYRYSGYPLTYANVTGAAVHDDGEVYAAIVWRLMELFGPSRRAALFRYVVDGMNYTPPAPAFEQMRDGLLAAVAAGPAKTDCRLVWRAFAQFGVGVGAKGTVLTSTSVRITPSFTEPLSCG